MLVSTRGRYALRVLLDLAEHQSEGFLPMKMVAQRQGVSLKYMERIMPVLTKHGLVEAVQGKGGGYRLVVAPEKCRVGDVLRLTEDDLTAVACMSCGSTLCDNVPDCRTRPMWQELNELVNNYFDGITLADLLANENQTHVEHLEN